MFFPSMLNFFIPVFTNEVAARLLTFVTNVRFHVFFQLAIKIWLKRLYKLTRKQKIHDRIPIIERVFMT